MRQIKVKFDNDNESTYQLVDGAPIEMFGEKMILIKNGGKNLFLNFDRVLWFELSEADGSE